MQKYLEEVKRITSSFSEFDISHVPRDSNSRADILSKLASTKGSENNKTLIQETIPKPGVILAVSLSQSWMDPILTYLQHGFIPQGQAEARKLVRKSAQYTILNGILYKRGFGSPMLRCVNPSQAEEILEEIHGGVYNHHMGGKSLLEYKWYSMNT